MHIVSQVYVYIIVLTLIVIAIGAQTKQYGYTGNYDMYTGWSILFKQKLNSKAQNFNI